MEHISDKEMLEWLRAPATDRRPPDTEDHLSQCEACRRRWIPLQQTWEDLGDWRLQVPVRDITPSVLEAIHQDRSIRLLEFRSLWRIAACIVLGLALGYWAANRESALNTHTETGAAAQLNVLGLESATGWSESILLASDEGRP